MSDNQYGVPVTLVTDPPVTGQTAVISGGTIAATGIAGGPVQVYVQGGTIGASFSFVGSVTTDIGNVKLEDADDNYAVIPPAQDLKTGSIKALVVQTIDRVGRTMSAGTLEAIMFNGSTANSLLANIDLNTVAASIYLAEIANTQGTQSTALLTTIANQQGTLATSALQVAGGLVMATLMNSQGTLATSALQTQQQQVLVQVMNNEGTLATAAGQTAQNILLVSLDAHQGTQATSALQTTGNQTLVQIMNNQGTQGSANAVGLATMNNQGTLATSAGQTAQNALLVSIDGHQGTLATSANQTDEIAKLAAILTAQGTQSTAGLALNNTLISVDGHLGTLATSAGQTAQNILLVSLDAHQGTQATSNLHTTGNTTLSNILAALQTTTGTNLEATLFNGTYLASNSIAVNVSGYTRHSIQHVISNGSVTVYIQDSLDGNNWNLETVDTLSTVQRLTGACKYIRAVYASGNGTLTTLLNSAR